MSDYREISLLRRIAGLNPDAGEIGPGMLKNIVSEAKSILDSYCLHSFEPDHDCKYCNGLGYTIEEEWPIVKRRCSCSIAIGSQNGRELC